VLILIFVCKSRWAYACHSVVQGKGRHEVIALLSCGVHEEALGGCAVKLVGDIDIDITV
jgi:hypothetical protein